MPTKGQHHSPDTIEKMRRAHQGVPLGTHHRAQISRGMQRLWEQRLGPTVSERSPWDRCAPRARPVSYCCSAAELAAMDSWLREHGHMPRRSDDKHSLPSHNSDCNGEAPN